MNDFVEPAVLAKNGSLHQVKSEMTLNSLPHYASFSSPAPLVPDLVGYPTKDKQTNKYNKKNAYIKKINSLITLSCLDK